MDIKHFNKKHQLNYDNMVANVQYVNYQICFLSNTACHVLFTHHLARRTSSREKK